VIARIEPSIEQIKWYVQAALNGFETLDLETAAEVAQSKLRALLRYCEAFDNTNKALAVSLASGVKPIIVLEGLVNDGQGGD
jgi:hypothetical protein